MCGLVHIYCGDGKGKTTAAAGLAVRAAGAGLRVLFVQFFKDGSSTEVAVLRTLAGVSVRTCAEAGRFANMSAERRAEAKKEQSALLAEALKNAREYDLLVLDEVISACNRGTADEETLLAFLRSGERPETVLTGREPSERLLAEADYITEMKKLRHPFDTGVAARRGIEF